MSNKKMIKVLVALMIFVLSLGTFVGCSTEGTSSAAGTLILKVNPEFEVEYDDDGDVLSIMPMNEDAGKLMEQVDDYQGKPSSEVIPALVTLMDKEGYIEKDTKGEGRNINIEVKYGSTLPSEDFLSTIVENVKVVFDNKQVTGKMIISGESNYGVSQYEISDYGNTDYKAAKTSIDEAVSSGDSYTDYSTTDYDGYNSDYDAATDYDGTNTDYASTYDSTTAYDSTSTYDDMSDDSTSNYDSNTTYDSTSNYDDTSDDSTSNYDSNTTYDSTSNYDDTSDDSTSNYDNNTTYDSTSNYDDTSDDSTSTYDDMSDDSTSNYDSGSSYDSDSGYDD